MNALQNIPAQTVESRPVSRDRKYSSEKRPSSKERRPSNNDARSDGGKSQPAPKIGITFKPNVGNALKARIKNTTEEFKDSIIQDLKEHNSDAHEKVKKFLKLTNFKKMTNKDYHPKDSLPAEPEVEQPQPVVRHKRKVKTPEKAGKNQVKLTKDLIARRNSAI